MNRKKWYCLQVGDSSDWDIGSTRKNEVLSMAKKEAKENKTDEIRICTIINDMCEDIEIYREAEDLNDENLNGEDIHDDPSF